MKRFQYFIAILLLYFSMERVFGNPYIVEPAVVLLDNFYFADSNIWHMTIKVYNPNDQPGYYYTWNSLLMDSIVIGGKHGRQLVVNFNSPNSPQYSCNFILSNEGGNGMTFDLENDELWVYTFYTEEGQQLGSPPIDLICISWGEPTKMFPILKPEQKICNAGFPGYIQYHYKSRCLSNNFDSAKIVTRGFVYDNFGKKITDQQFWFGTNFLQGAFYSGFLFPFEWGSDSSYTSGLLSRNGSDAALWYKYPITQRLKKIKINFFTFYAEPGDTLWIDLHITDSTFYVSSPEIPTPEIGPKVTCSPNPFHESVNVYIEGIGQNHPCQLTAADASGKIVCKKELTCNENQKIVINRNELGKSGIYHLTLSVGNSKIHSSTILMQ